jgi:hypothetical protein
MGIDVDAHFRIHSLKSPLQMLKQYPGSDPGVRMADFPP